MTLPTTKPMIRRCKVGGCDHSARHDDFYYCSKHAAWLSPNHRERYRVIRREAAKRADLRSHEPPRNSDGEFPDKVRR